MSIDHTLVGKIDKEDVYVNQLRLIYKNVLKDGYPIMNHFQYINDTHVIVFSFNKDHPQRWSRHLLPNCYFKRNTDAP